MRAVALGWWGYLDTAASLSNLALLYDAQGGYQQAEPLYRRALAIMGNAR